MVPQQGSDLSPTSSGVMFGSQLVDKNSATPYSDATQVRLFRNLLIEKISKMCSASVLSKKIVKTCLKISNVNRRDVRRTKL